MRLRWPVWGRRAARRSRPRVAQAVMAARAAQTYASGHAGLLWSAWNTDGTGARVYGRVAEWPHHMAAEAAPSLLWSTAGSGYQAGRPSVGGWADFSRGWLIEQPDVEDEAADATPMRAALDARRTAVWQAIDSTLGELRAS